MVSTSTDLQDQSGGSGSNTDLSTCNRISLDTGIHSIKSDQLKDENTVVDDFAPKVRKPYTITKQRERWTEEEHSKFLEALKLYGRAWRHIEEHVGTKTAVQIRSHAQKYFSKVVRESSSSDANSVKPIEIPPPRPKRKPLHPYPRKVAFPPKTGTHIPEKQTRSMSPILSVSEQDDRSPVSVLAAIGSDSLSSPSEPSPFPDENGSSSPDLENTSMSSEEQVPMKLELFPEDNDFVKEGKGDESSTQYLKLFGQTLLITNPQRPLWWALYGGASSPFLQLPIPVKTDDPSSDDKEVQREGSWTGSNTGSVNGGDRSDGECVETQSKEQKSSKCVKKGFLPCKRCLAETVSSEEREEQRIRLCL